MKKYSVIVILAIALMSGCNSGKKGRDYGLNLRKLDKEGIIIMSPKSGYMTNESELTLIVAIAERFEGKRYFLHTYLDGQIVDHGEIKAKILLEDLGEGDHMAEILIADHGTEEHVETEFRDSVSFIVEKSGSHKSTSSSSSSSDFTVPVTLKDGLGYSTPKEAFDALVKLAVSQDKIEYEKVFGLPMIEKKMKHKMKNHKMKMKSPAPLTLTSISDVQIVEKGNETISGDKIYYFVSKQVWNLSDGTVQKKKFDLHFKKIENKWIYYPVKGARFLLF